MILVRLYQMYNPTNLRGLYFKFTEKRHITNQPSIL